MSTVPRAVRESLCHARVTLNGQPARITGYGLDFAKVTDRATGLSAEWSWETVLHVVTNRNGAFRS